MICSDCLSPQITSEGNYIALGSLIAVGWTSSWCGQRCRRTPSRRPAHAGSIAIRSYQVKFANRPRATPIIRSFHGRRLARARQQILASRKLKVQRGYNHTACRRCQAGIGGERTRCPSAVLPERDVGDRWRDQPAVVQRGRADACRKHEGLLGRIRPTGSSKRENRRYLADLQRRRPGQVAPMRTIVLRALDREIQTRARSDWPYRYAGDLRPLNVETGQAHWVCPYRVGAAASAPPTAEGPQRRAIGRRK